MSLDKPTELPRFGTDQTNEVEPGGGQKDTGWLFQQIPPSSFQNWLQRVTYDWVAWLDERLDDDIDGSGTSENGVVLTDPLTTAPIGGRGVTKLRISDPVGGTVRTGPDALTINIGAGDTIQATGALFVTGGVLINDLVELSGTNSNDGYYLVSVITDEDNIDVIRLDGAAAVFAAEAGIAGTVTLYEKEDIKGFAHAPGGWEVSERVGGTAVTMKKTDGVGSGYDWVFPDALPSTKSVLNIDASGQVTAGDPAEVRTIGDGISSFGDFEGTDKTPFTNAIADLPAQGGTILVGRGTYTFTTPLVIAKANVKIIGLNGYANTIIIGSGAAFQAHNVGVIETPVDNVFLQGFEVRQTEGPFSNYCVFLKIGAEYCSITECFTDHTYAGADASEVGDKACISVEGSKNWVYRNRTNFHNTTADVVAAGIKVGLRAVSGDCEGNMIADNQNFVTENSGTASVSAAIGLLVAMDIDYGTNYASATASAARTINTLDNIFRGNHCNDAGNVGIVLGGRTSADDAGSVTLVKDNAISANTGSSNLLGTIGLQFDTTIGGSGSQVLEDNLVEGNSQLADANINNGNLMVWSTRYVSLTTPAFTASQVTMRDLNGEP